MCCQVIVRKKIRLNVNQPGFYVFSPPPENLVRRRHKASGAALGLSCAACFEQPAGLFAGCGAVRQAKIFASLKIKNGISFTPLNCALKALTFALKDSADAFVERLSK